MSKITKNTNRKYDYDYFVIGAGSGGVRSSRIAASHGAKVGIAEGRHMGGTCVNVGCVPKKLMAYAADYHAHFEDAEGFGWSEHKNPVFNWKKFIENKNKEILRLNEIYTNMLQKSGATVYSEYASFVDKNTLRVGNETITAEHILIATGGKPRMPEFDGAEHVIVSDDAFFLKDLPKHVVIYGGGYIAVEFAHIFKGMGSEVTIVYRGDLFMRGFDEDIRCHLRDEMLTQGINLRFNAEIEHIGKQGDDLLVTLTDNEESVLICDCVLSAIGRVPETENLNLENININLNKGGYLEVNDRYQTSIHNIYAIGDVTGRVELTPVAIKEGHWLADTLFSDIDRPCIVYHNIPTAVFSRPQIGTVGISESEAIKEGFDIEVFKSTFRPMAYTLANRAEKTFMKMIVEKKSRKILGLHICGMDAAEITQGFAVAIKAGATKECFDETVGIHPTSAEEIVTMR